MFGWLRRFTTAESAIIAFGKVPALAEYVRAGSRPPAASGFEDWVVKAMEWAASRRAHAWHPAFDAATPRSFILRAPGDADSLLTGVIMPSRDAVGRRFPLVIAAVLPAKTFAPVSHLTPALFRDFHVRARAQLQLAIAVTSNAEFRDCVEQLELPALSAIEQTTADYDGWSAEQPAVPLFERAFGEDAVSAAKSAVHTLIEASAPFHGQEAPASRLGVRLPIRADSPWLACFWLDVVRRTAGWKRTIPASFAADDVDEGTMLVQLGEQMPSGTLADLWDPDPKSESVCDLSVAADVDSSRFGTPLPPETAALFGDPASRVVDLLSRL